MRIEITTAPLDAAPLLATLSSRADGALLLFAGVVREENEGRAVSGIRYEAYEAMAHEVLAEIAAEASDRLGTDRIVVQHRIGELAVGEASVLIAVASPHRAEAFDACRYVIEEIKRRLPVWKHERYRDGDAAWVDGVAQQPAARRDG